MSRRIANIAAALLLSIHAALLAYAAPQHSPSIDEVGHMAAGLSHWHFGRFDLYRVNPPLVRFIATAPVALAHPVMDWEAYRVTPGTRGEFDCGERLIAANGGRSFWFFTIARWTSIPFSLLGACACYLWAAELYGARGGLLALALWCFSPNILAHAQMITPDVGATSIGAASCYVFWRWLRQPDWTRALACGALLGLAELTKATFVILYGVWLLAWIGWRFCGPSLRERTSFRGEGDNMEYPLITRGYLGQAAQFLGIILLSVYLINLGYAFEGSFRRLGEYHFVSRALAGSVDPETLEPHPFNRFVASPLSRLPIPLPANYVLGIDQQKSDFERGFPSYLRGEWRDGGWWYYYLYGLVIKVPLGAWALFLMAAWSGFVRQCPKSDRQVTRRDEFVLLLPAITVLCLVSSQTGFSHHLRYVLPIFPFLFIWIGRLGRLFDNAAERRGADCLQKWAIAVSLGWSVGSSLYYFPNSLSYFNELVGGPLGGRWHLLDSNIDWGQDLLKLRDWLDEHPEARPLGLAYFGHFNPRAAGIEFSLPPVGPVPSKTGEAKSAPPSTTSGGAGPRPGWYALSVTMLHGYKYPIPDGKGGKFYTDRPYFGYFRRFEPVARAGYSIYIYDLQQPEVDRVRRELGLPPLSDAARSARTGGERSPKPSEGS